MARGGGGTNYGEYRQSGGWNLRIICALCACCTLLLSALLYILTIFVIFMLYFTLMYNMQYIIVHDLS